MRRVAGTGGIATEGQVSIRASSGGPAAALPAQARDAVVMEKKVGFEFIEVGKFEPPAGNAPDQHGMFHARGRREDDVPQIGLLVARCDAKHAAGAVVIQVRSHTASQRFLVGFDADFDGLADRSAVLTHVNGLTFPQEFFPRFRGAENRRRRF